MLMLSDDAKSATELAKTLGFNKAKHITNRLTALYEKGVILKTRYNKQVYWSCESEPANVTIAGENIHGGVDIGLSDKSTSSENACAQEQAPTEQPACDYCDKTLEVLYSTIESLQLSVRVLSDELKAQNQLFNSVFEHMKTGMPPPVPPPASTVSPPPVHRTWPTTPEVANFSTPFPINQVAVDVPSDDSSSSTSEPPEVEQLVHALTNIPPNTTATPNVASFKAPPPAHPPLSIDYSNWRADPEQPSVSSFEPPVPVHQPREPPAQASSSAPVSTSDPTSDAASERSAPCPFNKHRVRMVKPLVAVAGDSMLKRLTSYEMSQECKSANAMVRPFVGARVEDMHDYIEPILRADPDIIVLHIGTNNIGDASYDGELVLVDKINDLINKIGDRLPHVIIVLSLPVCRKDSNFGRVLRFKEKIIEYCHKNFINYIANDNITRDHLNKSGVHLNAEGCKLLHNNITSFINFMVHHCFPIPV